MTRNRFELSSGGCSGENLKAITNQLRDMVAGTAVTLTDSVRPSLSPIGPVNRPLRPMEGNHSVLADQCLPKSSFPHLAPPSGAAGSFLEFQAKYRKP